MGMVPGLGSDKALAEQMDPDVSPEVDDRVEAFIAWMEQGAYELRKYVAGRIHMAMESQEVQEIVQDAIVRAYAVVVRGEFHYRNIPFTGYVSVIAQRLCYDEQPYTPLDDLEETLTPELDEAQASEDRILVEQLLQPLPARRQHVLRRTYLDDLSAADIAEELEISEELVRQERTRGLRGARR